LIENMQGPLRVAVVGVGSIGRHHARILAAMPGVELVAVVDPDEPQGIGIAQRVGTAWVPDIGPLLEAAALDAVTVAAPTAFHEEIASRTLAAGVPTLVEKPLAPTVDAGKRLVQLAERVGVPLAVGHIERFNPAVREMRRMIASGDLGDIISLTSRRLGPVPPVRQNTDVILDLAVHDLDIVAFLIGQEPSIVHAMGGRAVGSRHEDWADITLTAGMASCFLQVSWTVPIKIRRLGITGTSAYAEVNYINQRIDVFEAIEWRDAKDFDEFVDRFGEPKKHQLQLELEEPLQLELASFLESVRTGAPMEVPGPIGLAALELAINARDRIRAMTAETARSSAPVG